MLAGSPADSSAPRRFVWMEAVCPKPVDLGSGQRRFLPPCLLSNIGVASDSVWTGQCGDHHRSGSARCCACSSGIRGFAGEPAPYGSWLTRPSVSTFLCMPWVSVWLKGSRCLYYGDFKRDTLPTNPPLSGFSPSLHVPAVSVLLSLLCSGAHSVSIISMQAIDRYHSCTKDLPVYAQPGCTCTVPASLGSCILVRSVALCRALFNHVHIWVHYSAGSRM
jgi:hypothetical protein